MGLRSPYVGRLTMPTKTLWNFDEDFDVRGCGFVDVPKIVILGDLANVSYTVV